MFKINNIKYLNIDYSIYRLIYTKNIIKRFSFYILNANYIIKGILQGTCELILESESFISIYLKGLMLLLNNIILRFIKLCILKGKVYKESK